MLKMRMYLWWRLRILYLPTCQVRVTVGDSGLCCCTCVRYFEHWLTPLCVDSSDGGNISGTQTAQVLPKRNHVRNILLAVGGTGSLYVAYRIYSAPTDEVKQAKNWQVSPGLFCMWLSGLVGWLDGCWFFAHACTHMHMHVRARARTHTHTHTQWHKVMHTHSYRRGSGMA